MVIACPKCNRKYQIDTARIPATGTIFTCWSCRATVPVTGTGPSAESAPKGTGPVTPRPQPPAPSASPAGPAPGGLPGAAGPQGAVPSAAMRFFESLAADASGARPGQPPVAT